jgi:hypothetical protein
VLRALARESNVDLSMITEVAAGTGKVNSFSICAALLMILYGRKRPQA